MQPIQQTALPLSDKAVHGDAMIIGPYRYTLWRTWHHERPRVTFLMLNPSTADASQNDPTIRRCLNFTQCWGLGVYLGSSKGIHMYNIPNELCKQFYTLARRLGCFEVYQEVKSLIQVLSLLYSEG